MSVMFAAPADAECLWNGSYRQERIGQLTVFLRPYSVEKVDVGWVG
jgi:hypothetical protein